MRGVITSVAMVFAAGWLQSAAAQDIVVFDNGDRITGSIKSVEQGELVFDAPIADGDLHVNWARVARVESDRFFQFQTVTGERFLGRIRPETDPEAGTFVVEAGGVTQTYRRDHIVSVVQTVGQLRGLLEVSAGGGLSLSKSNDQKQFNADVRVGYQAPHYDIRGEVHSLFSTQREGANGSGSATETTTYKDLR